MRTGPSAAARRRPLRVALVTSSYNFIADGVALTLNRLVAHLEAHGAKVLVFAPVAKTAAFAHHGEIVAAPSFPLPLRADYRFVIGLTAGPRRRLEAFAPDIVHIAVPDFLGDQALALALARGWPVVASYHTRYETYLKDYGLDFLHGTLVNRLKRFYAACDEVYVPSASMAESLIADGFKGNFHLWERGVDTERFNPDRRGDGFRARWGIGEGELVVAFIGRIVREKRLETFAQVTERLTRAGIAHRTLVVGDGPDRPAFERRLPEAVFTGHLSGEDLPSAYASSDIFLFPSDTETFGSVTLEAMASGLPAVCADATGSRNLVIPEETGFLAPPGDVDAFFAPVARLARDAELRARLGAAARARSLEFSWDEAMAGLLERYHGVIAARGRVAA